MLFSIIVPVFNMANSIISTLDSILYQSLYQNFFEVIIIDDDSTDSSAEIIKDYIKDKPNFFYYHKKNSNWGGNINYIKHEHLTNGEYITILDADDTYYYNCLSNVKKLIEHNSNVDIVTSWYQRSFMDGTKKIIKPFWTKNQIIKNKDAYRTPYSLPIGKFYNQKLFYCGVNLKENVSFQDAVLFQDMISKSSGLLMQLTEVVGVWNSERKGNSSTELWNDKKVEDWSNLIESLINEHSASLVGLMYSTIDPYRKNLKRKLIIKEAINYDWLPWYLRGIYRIIVILYVLKIFETKVNH